MHILIEQERMVVLHKHENVNALANVAWIECQDSAYVILPLDDGTIFHEFTDMELKILYCNITQLSNHNLNRAQLIQVLFDLCIAIPTSDINEFEADRQAEFIPARTDKKWLYVKGASRPAQKADLFEPVGRKSDRNEKSEQDAKLGLLPALKPKRKALSLPTEQSNTIGTVKRPVTNSNGPKRGTAKAIIWAEADKKWQASGSPTDKSEVLALRKVIMAELETNEGIKKASSSSELGQWHKTRAPF